MRGSDLPARSLQWTSVPAVACCLAPTPLLRCSWSPAWRLARETPENRPVPFSESSLWPEPVSLRASADLRTPAAIPVLSGSPHNAWSSLQPQSITSPGIVNAPLAQLETPRIGAVVAPDRPELRLPLIPSCRPPPPSPDLISKPYPASCTFAESSPSTKQVHEFLSELAERDHLVLVG